MTIAAKAGFANTTENLADFESRIGKEAIAQGQAMAVARLRKGQAMAVARLRKGLATCP